MFEVPMSSVRTDINWLAEAIFQNNVAHGFQKYKEPTWKQRFKFRFFRILPAKLEIVPRNFGEELALIMSELGEALDAHRSGQDLVWWHQSGDPTVPNKPDGVAIELGDAIIRLLDTLAVLLKRADSAYRVSDIISMKMDYNATRPHLHGKKY